jgi:hypothetical protein
MKYAEKIIRNMKNEYIVIVLQKTIYRFISSLKKKWHYVII